MEVKDKHPAILVKDAILARSGIYVYSRDELLKMGISLADDKPLYKVYRPPYAIIDAKDKFSFAVVTKGHTEHDTSPDNFRQQADGIIGDSIDVVTLEDGNVALKGRVAFYTQGVADSFVNGSRETSAQYSMRLKQSRDPARDGYDFIMTEITSVNSVAVLDRGRGGSSVRVLDSMPVSGTYIGGNKMRSGFLSFLGIGKPKDAGFKFSDVLFGGIGKVKALDAADTDGIEKAVGEVMAYVASLGDSEAKEVLAGAVSDCLKNTEAVLFRKDDVAKKIDELYVKCQAADADTVKRILETGDGKDGGAEKKDGGAEKKDGGTEKKDGEGGAAKDSLPKDIGSVVDAAIGKALGAFNESLDSKIDAALRKALGEGVKNTLPAGDDRPAFAADGFEDKDASYLVRGIFGNR
jgi:hypothetical protein